MARPGGDETRAQIRDAVRRLLRERGVEALTLDAIADEVGVTRQAVLYHFGSRDGVLGEAYLEWFVAEADTVRQAADAAPRGLDGAGPVLDAALDWHLADLNRFRVLYAISSMRPLLPEMTEDQLREHVYPVTGQMYSALEQMLADGDLPDGVDARRLGIALHMFTLGVACYEAMLDVGDGTFAHDWHDIAEALALALTRRPS